MLPEQPPGRPYTRKQTSSVPVRLPPRFCMRTTQPKKPGRTCDVPAHGQCQKSAEGNVGSSLDTLLI